MLPQDQIDELKSLYPGLSLIKEAGIEYLLIPNLVLPTGCVPEKLNALLCPTPRDGYTSRLFFAQQVKGPHQLNWNANGVRIGEQNVTLKTLEQLTKRLKCKMSDIFE